jgi:ABC-2 type transport system permease protein
MAATAVAMSGVGITLAAVVLVVRRGELIVAFATLGLTLLGGAYFPISVLPDWIEPLAKILPTTFAFNGVRSALYSGNDWAIPTLELLAFAAVALPASIALLHAAIGIARDRGLLSTP